ncbi:MAG: EAL domain-containing protein [Rhizobium sp.]
MNKSLMRGIERGEVWPAFQPIIDIQTGAVAGFEILARWRDARMGDIPPATFIPELERHGLVDLLTEALMRRACEEAHLWDCDVPLAFNVSPLQLLSDDFLDRFVDTIRQTGFAPERVEVEVTESSLFADDDKAYDVLHALNGYGIKVAIDDFGTGYSSLARLESFPFHKLKIDTRFVGSLDTEASRRRIVSAIIGLGHSLGITVVAEGIETAAQEAILRDLGCDLGQGWLYGKGEPAAKATEVLKTRGSLSVRGEPLDVSQFQQQHQLDTLYNQAPVGLAYLDLNYRLIRANNHFAVRHGRSPSEIIGKTIYDLLGDRKPLLDCVEQDLRQAAGTDLPVVRHIHGRGRDDIVFHGRVKDVAGEIIGFSVVLSDITNEIKLKNTLAQVQAENEIQMRQERDYAEAILRSLPVTFYQYGPDLRLKRWNRNHELVTGYTAEEHLGAEALMFIAEEDRGKVTEAIRGVFERGYVSVEADLRRKDGKRIPYLLTGVRFEHDGEQSFLGVGTEISGHLPQKGR